MWKCIKCCKYISLYKVYYFVCLKKRSTVYIPNSVLLQLQRNLFFRLYFWLPLSYFVVIEGQILLQTILFFPFLLYMILCLKWYIRNLCTYCYEFYSVNCGLRNADYGIVIKYINQEFRLLTWWENFCCLFSFLEVQIRKLKCDLFMCLIYA